MTGWFWAGLVTGIAANECCAVSEWTARKLVRWSAHIKYGDTERAEIRAQELEAVISDRPGQLFKLITAVCFVFSAARTWLSRAATGLSIEQVSVWGSATLKVTAAAISLFVGAALLTQLVLDRPSPQNIVSSLSQLAQELRADEAQIANLRSAVNNAATMTTKAQMAFQCELYGLMCVGGSGVAGAGPLARLKQVEYGQDRNVLVWRQEQLRKADLKFQALEKKYLSSGGFWANHSGS